MCVNKQPTYNQGKLKLTRYIYWTSPLAKAKGNVWQGQPKKEPIHVYMCIHVCVHVCE